MSTGIAVSLVVMASLSVAFVYANSKSAKRVGATRENMEELREKLMKVERARKAYERKEEDDEIKANQEEYENYVSILNK